jgi:ethanolamine ammonia-lyase large subunit
MPEMVRPHPPFRLLRRKNQTRIRGFARGSHENRDGIVNGVIANAKQHDPKAKVIVAKNMIQDNYPVIYIERDELTKTINSDFKLRSYMLISSWRSSEIIFECGSSLVFDDPRLKTAVEGQIKRIIGSLQFNRAGLQE